MSDDVEIKILNEKAVADQMRKILENQPDFRPVIVKVENPEGIFVEYGTSPAKDTRPGKGHNSVVYQRFVRWYGDEHIAFRIYKDTMVNGLIPRPFFRPAYHTVKANIKHGKYKNSTLMDIANDLKKEMENAYYTAKKSRGGRPTPALRVSITTITKATDVPYRKNYSSKIYELDTGSRLGHYPGRSRYPRIPLKDIMRQAGSKKKNRHTK